MNKIITPFIITFLAGISTIIGTIPTYFSKKYENMIINVSLAFSAGVMITISFFSLIPESFNYLGISIFTILLILIFVNIGIIISTFIDNRIEKRINNNSLYKIGIVGLITLILHNVPEGITTYLTSSNNLKIGISLSIAIALHNIPEGISIAIPIYYSTNNRLKAFIYTVISGFSEFVGALLAFIFLKKYINDFLMSIILSITAGVMMQISCYELLPTSLKYKRYYLTTLSFLLGFIIMILTIFVFKI